MPEPMIREIGEVAVRLERINQMVNPRYENEPIQAG
jgi:hypothetical protein